jgi:hypothetical protein
LGGGAANEVFPLQQPKGKKQIKNKKWTRAPTLARKISFMRNLRQQSSKTFLHHSFRKIFNLVSR